MRKIIIFLLSLFLIGQTYAINENDIAKYQEWKMQNYSMGDIITNKDSISISSNFIGSGDLLSSLIVDQKLRDIMKSDIYMPDYLINLDQIITKTLKRNFYSRSIQHIGTNIDVLVGSYSVDISPTSNKIQKHSSDPMIIIRSNNTVFSINAKKIQIYNNTATGGDTFPCNAKKINNTSLIWSCFTGILKNNTDIIGNKYIDYTISLKNGKILKKQERKELL